MRATSVALCSALMACSTTSVDSGARGVSTSSQTGTAIESRWRESFDAFAGDDRAHSPSSGGVVFVGSSSIRLWKDLEREFGTEGIIKRGFGGSRMSDCARYVPQLVLAYRPRIVVIYAGDNDLAEGGTPEGVLHSYESFVEQVHASLPATRIAFVSVKPSPSRESLIPAIIVTNELVEAFSKRYDYLEFIDVYSKMLDAKGHARSDLFLADRLHLNAAGYAIWKDAIAGHLH